MTNCNLEKLIGKMNSAVLEIDISNNENKENYLQDITNDIGKKGYTVIQIMESKTEKGLYHIHLTKNCAGVKNV